jgi:hypothetical protein
MTLTLPALMVLIAITSMSSIQPRNPTLTLITY